MPKIIEVDTSLGHFRCYEDTVGNALRSGQFWDQQIQPALDEADPTGWAIDIGANIGWFTVYLAKRHRGVIAVEAHPQTFQLCWANVVRNVPTNQVVGVDGAAYDCGTWLELATPEAVGWEWDGSADLATCPHPASIVYHPIGLFNGAGRGRVWGRPIDELTQAIRVSLIKVDAQGCDLRALKGLQATIERDRPLIVFEYEYAPSMWNGCSWQDYLDFFSQLNYTVTRIREDLWDYVARPHGQP